MKVGDENHRRSLHKIFPTDTRQRLADRKRMWKLAMKAIEDRSTKISQQIRVKDWLIEEECGSWRRSPSKITPQKFPTDARQRLLEEECGSWR